MDTRSWRLIRSGATNPFLNMGLDEAILLNADAPPTLRLYQWSPPCLSLGYFQKSTDFDLDAVRAQGFAVTRRITGGGAIAHHQELTYAVICSELNPLVRTDRMASYMHFQQPFVDTFLENGIVLTARGSSASKSEDEAYCFARQAEFDLVMEDCKVLGSAQRRTRGRFLQHGSCIFGASGMPDTTDRISATDRIDATAHQVGEIDMAQFEEALIQAFTSHLQIELIPGETTDAELAHAHTLAEEKYNAPDWIHRA